MARSLLALAACAACLAWPCAQAFADDEDPQPRKMRILIERETEEPAARAAETPRSPMPVIERWLAGKLGGLMTGEDPLGGMLEQWFEGGEDVPMADLRDALKAEGWNAATMRAWMMGEMLRAGSALQHMPGLARGALGRGRRALQGRRGMHGWRRGGPQAGPGPWGWAPRGGPRWGGPWARGPQGGMPWGPGPQGHPFGGRAHHGHGQHGQGHPGHGPWGPGPRAWGPWAWGPQRGPHGMQGGPRHGMGGGRGMGPGPMGPMGPGAMRGPQVHTEQRAFILWHDGTRWQRRELPGGMPGQGGMPGARPGAGFRGPGPRGPGVGGGMMHGMPDLEAIEKMLEQLQGGEHGGQLDPRRLQAILKALRGQLGAGGPDAGAMPWLELFGDEVDHDETDRGDAGKDDEPAPRRMKIRVRRGDGTETKVEDVVIVEPKKAPKDDR